MQSTYLRTLIEVAESGSFSSAAEALCVTQSAVSRRIALLEERYGCPLIDRAKSPLEATAAGRVVIEKSRRILALEIELLDGLTRIEGTHSFGFCCTPSFGSAHLPGVLAAYMRNRSHRTEIRFGIDTPPAILKSLREGAYDLAVIEHCPGFKLDGFATAPLGGDEVVFLSAADSSLPEGEVELEDLFQFPLFVRPPGCCARSLLESGLDKLGHRLADFRQVVEVSDAAIKVRSVIDCNGLAFLSRNLARQHNGSVKIHCVEGIQHDRLRTLVLGPRAEHCPVIAEFRGALLGAFAALENPDPTASEGATAESTQRAGDERSDSQV